MKMMDVDIMQINTIMKRVDANDPAVYERFGVGAMIKARQDNLTVNLINVLIDNSIPEDEAAERRIAYEMHVQDCKDCGMPPLSEVLGMQWLEDSYEATVDWCISKGLI